MSRDFPLTFYNIDNGRDPDTVAREIRALLDVRPAILGLCETTNIALPGVADYLMLRDTGRPGRDNIAAYVKQNLAVSGVKWIDCHETWTRTNPGATGQHPPRSILQFVAGRLKVWVAHQPPKGTDNTHDAQQEGIDKLTGPMAPWTRDDWADRTEADQQDAIAQARVLLWDANRKKDEDGPGPKMLGNRIDGETAGAKIDCATYRGEEVKGVADVRYFDHVAGVNLQSDHGHAFGFTLRLYDA